MVAAVLKRTETVRAQAAERTETLLKALNDCASKEGSIILEKGKGLKDKLGSSLEERLKWGE